MRFDIDVENPGLARGIRRVVNPRLDFRGDQMVQIGCHHIELLSSPFIHPFLSIEAPELLAALYHAA
jgi:hypothetical protein